MNAAAPRPPARSFALCMAELRAGVVPDPSTAWALAAYREELHACGFQADEITALVMEAARHPEDLKLHPEFVARAEPTLPLRIENHEPGSPEDTAARIRFGLDAPADPS